jgi:hypothetical protein
VGFECSKWASSAASVLNAMLILACLLPLSVHGTQQPNHQRFLDLCDEHGILVWNEALAWGNSPQQLLDPLFIAAQLATVSAMVDSASNNPSVGTEYPPRNPATTAWTMAICYPPTPLLSAIPLHHCYLLSPYTIAICYPTTPLLSAILLHHCYLLSRHTACRTRHTSYTITALRTHPLVKSPPYSSRLSMPI